MQIAKHARLDAVVRLATSPWTPKRRLVERLVLLRSSIGLRAMDACIRTHIRLYLLQRRPFPISASERRRVRLPCTSYGTAMCAWIHEDIHASVGSRENAPTIRPSREDSPQRDVSEKANCTNKKGHHVVLAKTSCTLSRCIVHLTPPRAMYNHVW